VTQTGPPSLANICLPICLYFETTTARQQQQPHEIGSRWPDLTDEQQQPGHYASSTALWLQGCRGTPPTGNQKS